MLLQDLVDTIERLKARLANHSTELRANETRTRMALIDPMLAVLGWDPADPSLVMPEYAPELGKHRADYALIRHDGKPAAILEAKKLGESLEQYRRQMLSYAVEDGIAYAGITDGNLWQLYSVFEQKPIEERRILNISISNDPTHEIALSMLALWRPNIGSGYPAKANSPIAPYEFQDQNQSFKENTKNLQQKQDSLVESSSRNWIPIAEYVVTTGVKPEAVRMANGTEYPAKHWYQVVSAIVKWLWLNNYLSEENTPVLFSKNRYVVNYSPKHPTGKRFSVVGGVEETPLYIGTNRNVHSSIGAVKKLLDHCSQNHNDFSISVKQ